jgi:hypothetical protein
MNVEKTRIRKIKKKQKKIIRERRGRTRKKQDNVRAMDRERQDAEG